MPQAKDTKEKSSGRTRRFIALAVFGVLNGVVSALVLGKPAAQAVPVPVAPAGAAQGQGQAVEVSPGPIAVVMAVGTVEVRDWGALGRLLADQAGLADQIKAGLPVGQRIMGLPGVQRLLGSS